MRRVVIDTNVYVDWINGRQHEDTVFQRDTVKYLSAVVLMELRAGAFSRRDLRFLSALEATFERAARLLVPSRAVFAEAGDALRSLQAGGYRIGASHSIANDVLIALSARSIGATVVTQNERDYRAIQAVRRFRLAIVRV
ncbi:MAG: type II toxin-antitoxin system VapC family toxin [Myxococcales bacterium]